MVSTREAVLALINNSIESIIKERKSCLKDLDDAYVINDHYEQINCTGRESGLDYGLTVLETMKHIVKKHWKE